MSKRSKPLPRGFVNNIILQSLVDGDKYGYEIIKEVEEITGGEIILKQPSLYSSLKRFETRGFISSYWGDSTIGGRRHYYTLTETGREHFEQQIKTGEISVEDIVYENVEEEVKAEISEQAELILEAENSLNKTTDKEVSAEINNVVDETKQVEQTKTNEQPKAKPVVKDVDSDDYNVFDLLEADNNKTESEYLGFEEVVEAEETIEFEENDAELLEENADFVNETFEEDKEEEEEVDSEVLDDEDEVYTEEIYEYLSDNKEIEFEEDDTENHIDEEHKLEEIENDVKDTLTAPLPEQTSLDLNSFETENYTNEIEVNNNKTEFIEPAKELNNSEAHASEETNEDFEEIEKTEKPKAEILVDEFGIKKSSLDTAPKRTTKQVDNVGERRQYVDPLYRTVEKKQEEKNEQLPTNVKTDAVSSYDKKNFEETDKKISERIQKAVVQKFGKIESLDYKNLLGEVYFDEKEIEQQKLENDTIKLPDSYDDEYFESYESDDEETSTIKNTPYTSLEESLEKEGFKFKPYNIKFIPSKKRPEFLLSNKVGFYLGLVMFVLMVAQFAGFGAYLASANFSFKSVDKVIIGLSLIISALVLISGVIPYISSRKKRKYNSFRLSTTMIYMLVVFISLLLLTYAINTFFGLSFKNIKDYMVTLFLPIIVVANLLIWPVVYRLLITSKKFY